MSDFIGNLLFTLDISVIFYLYLSRLDYLFPSRFIDFLQLLSKSRDH